MWWAQHNNYPFPGLLGPWFSARRKWLVPVAVVVPLGQKTQKKKGCCHMAAALLSLVTGPGTCAHGAAVFASYGTTGSR